MTPILILRLFCQPITFEHNLPFVYRNVAHIHSAGAIVELARNASVVDWFQLASNEIRGRNVTSPQTSVDWGSSLAYVKSLYNASNYYASLGDTVTFRYTRDDEFDELHLRNEK